MQLSILLALDIFTIFNEVQYFAELILPETYLQIEVDPESRVLLPINAHRIDEQCYKM